MVFHVLNRGARRRGLFSKDADFAAFDKVMHESMRVGPMRICAVCLMSNMGTESFGRTDTLNKRPERWQAKNSNGRRKASCPAGMTGDAVFA
jgi:hypothetical protein